MGDPKIITKRKSCEAEQNIGYKKVFCKDGYEVVLLLKLDTEQCIKKPTPLTYGIAKSVTVLAIYDMWGYKTDLKEAYSHWDKNFRYEVGQTYAPQNGIWFWPTFKQAQKYWLNAGGVTDQRFIKLVNIR